jgi:hypothetical protein
MSWSVAFAKQAKADLEARDWLLGSTTLPECHELHFLQMACEKLCKAYLMARPGADPIALQRSHAYVAKNLPIIVRQQLAEQSGHLPKDSHLIGSIRRLAEQIERLAPANDAGGTAPSNCEYPWTDAKGQIIVPAEHSFRLSLLYERAGVTLLKIMRVAADRLINPEG